MKQKEAILVCKGGPKPIKFTYMVERSMSNQIDQWLQQTFRGYGEDYYYSHGEIWFKTGKQVTLFLLRWP